VGDEVTALGLHDLAARTYNNDVGWESVFAWGAPAMVAYQVARVDQAPVKTNAAQSLSDA
jgi:hypothetical protein